MNTSCLNRLRKNKTSLGKQTIQPGGMEVQDIQEKGLNDIQVFGGIFRGREERGHKLVKWRPHKMAL